MLQNQKTEMREYSILYGQASLLISLETDDKMDMLYGGRLSYRSVNPSVLITTISAANELLDTYCVGDELGQAPAIPRDSLHHAIADALVMAIQADQYTQAQLTTKVQKLTKAMTVFEESIVKREA